MKTFAAIHQQTLDIIARLGRRPHTGTEAFERVIHIHNTYAANICALAGVAHLWQLGTEALTRPLTRTAYRTATAQ